MQKVSFPPLRSGIIVSVAASEPPERSWSRYKEVLIDSPKDSNLLQRQKLWNFQKLNRGAFRSQLASLPDIPYRVHTGTADNEDGYSDDFDDYSDIEDPGFNSEMQTTTEKGTFSKRERNAAAKQRSSMLGFGKEPHSRPSRGRTNVKFSHNTRLENETTQNVHEKSILPEMDKEFQGPEVELDEDEDESQVLQKLEIKNIERDDTLSPIPTFPSNSSHLPELKLNIGHTSHLYFENVSILDYISGNRTACSNRSNGREAFLARDPVFRRREDAEVDRELFEQVVGDKEIIDTKMYDNFARVRPAHVESGQSDSNNDRYNEFIKGTPRTKFTPRTNNDFSVYKQAQPKSGQKVTPSITANVNNVNGTKPIKLSLHMYKSVRK
ncbi:hypothetical protein DPMN_018259 [Dreissena polymorpha]|uniref:Uncharacterized protein n=1 Tax=Dreissena polymorpha TaxID=45954 RepID=A0A9D4NGX6_DREPO|nr:hypothetical protein DPMN_018259 [Dreissena polymorpha]